MNTTDTALWSNEVYFLSKNKTANKALYGLLESKENHRETVGQGHKVLRGRL